MSVSTEINRIVADKNTIRNKLVELGLAETTANLDTLATIIGNLINQGAITATVKEGETYIIPKGYHNGSGTVSGVAGGGNYSLQSKTATPTKSQQNITPDSGYYGLSDVTIAAIPEAYQDVTAVTAAAGDVLTGKVYVTADGTIVTGTMSNNGAVTKVLDCTTVTFTIPKGYHNGSGKVTITLEEKTVTPTKSEQTVTPTSGKVLSKVTVNPIPDAYQDVTGVTAGAAEVLAGEKIVDANGNVVTGTMPNNGAVTQLLDTATTEYIIPEGYHDGSGAISVEPIDVELDSFAVTALGVGEIGSVLLADAGKVIRKVSLNALGRNWRDVDEQTLEQAKVLQGQFFWKAGSYVSGGSFSQGYKLVEGTMANNGAVSQSLNAGGSYTIPEGYHDGTGTVTANSLSSQTAGTAAAAEILDGETAWVGGVKVEGSMPNKGAVTGEIEGLTTTEYIIPAGYHNGSGKVSLTSDIEEALAAI